MQKSFTLALAVGASATKFDASEDAYKAYLAEYSKSFSAEGYKLFADRVHAINHFNAESKVRGLTKKERNDLLVSSSSFSSSSPVQIKRHRACCVR